MTEACPKHADSIGSIFFSPLPYTRPRVRLLIRSLMLLHHPWIRVENPEALVDLPEPVIFAFNHNNSFESLGVPAAVIFHRAGRSIHFMIDWMYLKIPLLGVAMRQIDQIPVYTKPARWRLNEDYRQAHLDHSPVEACHRFLRQGKSVGIFPEGTRNPSPTTLLPGRLGLGRLALVSGAPVVPIGIEFLACRRLNRMPRIGRCAVRIGEPMLFDAELSSCLEQRCSSKGSSEVTRFLSRLVVDRVMETLARLCNKEYPHSLNEDPPGEIGSSGLGSGAVAGGLPWHDNRLRA